MMKLTVDTPTEADRARYVRRRQQLGALGCLALLTLNGLLWAIAFWMGTKLWQWLRH
jgi:hypothetical protein